MRPTEAQLRMLDNAVRYDLSENGLLAFVLQMRDEAVTKATSSPPGTEARAVGRIEAWNDFYRILNTVPAWLKQIDDARRAANPPTEK